MQKHSQQKLQLERTGVIGRKMEKESAAKWKSEHLCRCVCVCVRVCLYVSVCSSWFWSADSHCRLWFVRGAGLGWTIHCCSQCVCIRGREREKERNVRLPVCEPSNSTIRSWRLELSSAVKTEKACKAGVEEGKLEGKVRQNSEGGMEPQFSHWAWTEHSTTGWTMGWLDWTVSSGQTVALRLAGINKEPQFRWSFYRCTGSGWESTAVDYGLFGQCGPAPALSGRGRLRSHVFTTGPDVTGCCHTHSGGLHHYHLTFDHPSNGNQHYCTSIHLLQCMCAEWHHILMWFTVYVCAF